MENDLYILITIFWKKELAKDWWINLSRPKTEKFYFSFFCFNKKTPKINKKTLNICPIVICRKRYPKWKSGSLKNSNKNLNIEYKIRKYDEIIPGLSRKFFLTK